MSHTTSITNVVIQDIDALRAAVSEMNSAGIHCELLQNTKPRAYYSNQDGMGVADYVLKLDDASYDVGLYKNQTGGYEARTDFWGGSVEKLLGAATLDGENRDQARLGKLYQSYAICAAEKQARRSGRSVTRRTLENGTVQLVMTA